MQRPMASTEVSASLHETTVLAPDGRAVPLASQWETRAAVLALVRHYG